MKDLPGKYYATSGNMGKLAGPSRQEKETKDLEERQMKEVWQKVSMVKQLK